MADIVDQPTLIKDPKIILFNQIERINRKISESRNVNTDIFTLELMLKEKLYHKTSKKYIARRKELSERFEAFINSKKGMMDEGSASQEEFDNDVGEMRQQFWLSIYSLLMDYINEKGLFVGISRHTSDEFTDDDADGDADASE